MIWKKFYQKVKIHSKMLYAVEDFALQKAMGCG
jgi:hypothetical protein